MYRIGFGYDVHRLESGRKLILGGVEIPFEKGLLGHSDADVLIHAIIDALLGALALGDIGKLFPDNDMSYKDIDSRILLRQAYAKIRSEGYILLNLDSTICAQEPKLAPYIMQMRSNLADDMETETSSVSVKATTEEGLGISGSKQGICAYATLMLVRVNE
ncbi:MAG: 2-C-methyl-D-erythritol 2,4-cyclodiphosphate synthase [Candidatus Cloacimonetes bacterium HGW-Cloacimonetes-2]|jgi:2-C-methyl-D-erythritol 2,4-cyclodiphosphate synthase|nr:MAG: 2-C-methyl-D-erythritol 2,4-cyclodiphosphate synthase [Candidatus Cloacimonetes bacterium HGW-Cloacimonetes-2]